MNPVASIFSRREMLASLVGRDLKSRYKGSVLGFLWSIMTPLFMAVIYVFFLRLLARGVPIEEVIIGVFAWQFTVQSVNTGMECVSGNASLVKKVAFPRIILPAASTLASLVNFLLSLVVQFALLFVILSLRGSTVSPWALLLPLLVVHHTLFNFSLAMLVGSSNVYFRDTQHLVGVLMSAWFFVSPVMYPVSFVEQFTEGYPFLIGLYSLNPLAGIVSGYRAMILPASAFHWSPYSAVGLAWPLLLLVLGYVVYRRAQRNFADML